MVFLRIRDLHELLPVMVADVRSRRSSSTRKLPDRKQKNKNPDAGFLPMSAGASQPGGDKGALQPAQSGEENFSGTERFGVSASRAQGTAIRIATFGERRRKHVPLGVVSATAAAFRCRGGADPQQGAPFCIARRPVCHSCRRSHCGSQLIPRAGRKESGSRTLTWGSAISGSKNC